VTGRDAKLSYTNTSFGRIQLGSEEGGAVHSGIPTAGAPVIDMDGKLFQKKSSSDFISYAAQVGSWGFQYKLSESSKGSGLGAGSQGSAGVVVGQRTSDFILGYGSGALTGAVAYRTYDNRDKDSIATAMGLTKDNVVVLQLGYDAGVAKFGLGYQVAKASVGPQVQDVLVGVSKDLGAWTIGATYAMSTTSGAADTPTSAYPAPAALPVKAAWKAIMQQADGTATGYSLGAQYNFSKRTNVLVRYANWLRSGYEQFEAFGATSNPGEFGYGDRASETSILLVHNF
jgi:predicted porin